MDDSEIFNLNNKHWNNSNYSDNKRKNGSSVLNKIIALEELIKDLNNDMNFYKQELSKLRSIKDTLQSKLSLNSGDVKDYLTNDFNDINIDLWNHLKKQKIDNSKIQQQISALKGEKTAMLQQLISLQRRVSELEFQYGEDNIDYC